MKTQDNKKKVRLDLALVERGLFDSRQEAQTAIMDGAVLVNNEKVTKSGTSVSASDKVELRPGFVKQRYVSRGGLKLEKALHEFSIITQDRICLDIGASTGGFTDCLLQHGAKQVYAIDVGYGQLDWKLRTDERVVVIERVNARHLTAEELYNSDSTPRATLAVIDCSFISLEKILPATQKLLACENSEIVCLVKPQFEAGRESVKKGVVKDPKTHQDVLTKVSSFAPQLNLHVQACTFSPLKGPKGNIEYLLLLSEKPQSKQIDLSAIVSAAINTMNTSDDAGE